MSPTRVTRRRLLRDGAVAAAAVVGAPASRAAAAERAPVLSAPPDQRLWAGRAQAAYHALQRHFRADDGSGLYLGTVPVSPGSRHATLWDFSRVLVGTMALAGIPAELIAGARYGAEVRDRVSELIHYFDAAAQPPGYDSCVLPPVGIGGNKYYDDAAWIGLALAQHHRMTGAVSSLAAARRVLEFVYPGGWDMTPAAPFPGGVFWVQQGVGLGLANHDRTTTSNAPNAELAFQLAQLDSEGAAAAQAVGVDIHDWVLSTLYDVDGSGLVSDHVRGSDGTIDPTLYTYNQGAVVAADVMRYRLTGDSTWLEQARPLAVAALVRFPQSYLIAHSAAFNAIYFRGLLQLVTVLEDMPLQAQVRSAMTRYADAVWHQRRSPEGLYHFSDSPPGAYSVLDQGAVLQLFATLAWDPADYPKLA